jgi:hypothetical protein
LGAATLVRCQTWGRAIRAKLLLLRGRKRLFATIPRMGWAFVLLLGFFAVRLNVLFYFLTGSQLPISNFFKCPIVVQMLPTRPDCNGNTFYEARVKRL